MKTGCECPLIPMAAITGAPSREFLFERLKNWHSVGVTQFMIYARSGLELEYMSEAWLDRCEWICEDAQLLGFTSIWLYDEMNWPSGTCNGEVMREDPSYAVQVMCVREDSSGGYVFELRRGPKMADLFNPDAVAAFIRLTHRRYEKRLGRFFGTLIKGFFSDEPDIAYFGGFQTEGDPKLFPWYDGLEEDYRILTDGELREDIVRGLKTGCDFWQGPCHRLMAKKFKAAYADQLSRWCAERGMVLTGHLMGEYSSSTALRCSGHILEVLSCFSLPGIDDICTYSDNDRIEYLTYSTGMYAIEKQGNQGGTAELFALGPCDMSLEKMVSRFFFCAAFGIDHYVLAVSQTEMRGNAAKPDYFNPFTETQPWFPAFRKMGEDAAVATRWAKKIRDCEIAVRYPYETQPLTDLLRHLADEQLGWKLLLPEESADTQFVLSCADGNVIEERSGRTFFDYGVLDREMLCKLERSMLVCETDGELAHGVFLRRFTDGSALVFNLSGKARSLVLKTAGNAIPFSLSADGFFAYEPEKPPMASPTAVLDLPRPGWEITTDSPNTMRADFEQENCEFTVTEDLTELRLAVRHYAEQVTLLLDGKPVEAASPCRSLVQGFRELYRESEEFALAAGKHVLTLAEPTKDYPYLPAVVLIGNFAVDEQKRLSRYRNDGIGLYGYVGRIRLRRDLQIPAGTTSLRAETFGLAAELVLDGQSLGQRIHTPFEWELSEQTGTVKAELILFTSCARLFGETHKWRKEFSPDNARPLLFYTR